MVRLEKSILKMEKVLIECKKLFKARVEAKEYLNASSAIIDDLISIEKHGYLI